MNRFYLLFSSIMLVFSLTTNSYAFFETAKVESVKMYDDAHELYEDGKYSEAEIKYQQFMQANPNSKLVEAAMFYSGKSCTEQKKYDQAIAHYNALIDKYKEGFWVETAKEEISKIQQLQKSGQ